MKAFVFYLQIAQSIERSYWIFSFFFLKSKYTNPQVLELFLILQKFYNYLRITYHILSFNSPPPKPPFKIPPKSFIYIQSSRRALDRHPTKRNPSHPNPQTLKKKQAFLIADLDHVSFVLLLLLACALISQQGSKKKKREKNRATCPLPCALLHPFPSSPSFPPLTRGARARLNIANRI